MDIKLERKVNNMIEMKQDENGITIKSDNSDNMHELMKEIKEKTKMLIDKYNVEYVDLYIDDKKDVYVEVRI